MKYQLYNKWNLNNHGQYGECNEQRKSENRQKAIAKIQVTDEKKLKALKMKMTREESGFGNKSDVEITEMGVSRNILMFLALRLFNRI